jgi:soluble lytic murein transglycosylase-like protein
MRRWALLYICLAQEAVAAVERLPPAAAAHQRTLTRIVQTEFGLDAPVALHGAQIHTESAWRDGARSGAGAEGLAQFMPATSNWIADIYPDLGKAAPWSPGWAMRAMVRYNRWHLARIQAADGCERWAFALSAYNGGLGWVQKDRKLATTEGADQARWWGETERHTSRSETAAAENREYVRRILRLYQPRYLATWGGPAVCIGGMHT